MRRGNVKGYHICVTDTETELVVEVERMIEGGWEPIGGIAVLPEHNGYSLAQALIMRENIGLD